VGDVFESMGEDACVSDLEKKAVQYPVNNAGELLSTVLAAE
jgi:hypothetical protein